MRSGRSQPFATRRSSFPQSNAPALCLETHFEKLQKAIRGNAPESFFAWRVSACTHRVAGFRAHTRRATQNTKRIKFSETRSRFQK